MTLFTRALETLARKSDTGIKASIPELDDRKDREKRIIEFCECCDFEFRRVEERSAPVTLQRTAVSN